MCRRLRSGLLLIALVSACGPSEEVKFGKEQLLSDRPGDKFKAAIMLREQAEKGDEDVKLLLPELLSTVAIDTQPLTLGELRSSPSAEAKKAIMAIKPPPVKELIAFLGPEHRDKAGVRTGAIQVLGEMKASEATGALVAILEDGNDTELMRSYVEFDVLWALQNIADPRSTKPLVAYVRRGTERCAVAASALGSIGTNESIDALIELAGDRSFSCRAGAVEGLGKSGSARAIPVLISLMNDKSEDSELRSSAVFALSSFRSADVVEALIVALDANRELRTPAAVLPNPMSHALEKITGQSLGEDRAAWETWWAANKASFATAR